MDLDFEKPLIEVEARIAELKKQLEAPDAPKNDKIADEISGLEKEATALKKKIYSELTPWQTVQVARHKERPLFRDYIAGAFSEFIELHGDRCFGDDKGIIGGFAMIGSHRVMLMGHQKGKTLEENIESNFGMANPEGYRKALRLMKLAEKYKIPVVTFIDTPGAYPGADAEARGQAEAIANNLTEMASLETPIVVVVTGEGGSGGALGIAVGDCILMLSNAVYSVISPEGCASILWRDGSKASIAAEALKITAKDLLQLKVIDEIITEPAGGAHRNREATIEAVKEAIIKNLKKLKKHNRHKWPDRRYEKFAQMGRMKK